MGAAWATVRSRKRMISGARASGGRLLASRNAAHTPTQAARRQARTGSRPRRRKWAPHWLARRRPSSSSTNWPPVWPSCSGSSSSRWPTSSNSSNSSSSSNSCTRQNCSRHFRRRAPARADAASGRAASRASCWARRRPSRHFRLPSSSSSSSRVAEGAPQSRTRRGCSRCIRCSGSWSSSAIWRRVCANGSRRPRLVCGRQWGAPVRSGSARGRSSSATCRRPCCNSWRARPASGRP